MRAEFRHNEIRRCVKDDIADVEQRHPCANLFVSEVEFLRERVALGCIHGQRETDIRPDGGADEVEDPESYKSSTSSEPI
jgi:hypothetical protein